jgi:hypothetical protein
MDALFFISRNGFNIDDTNFFAVFLYICFMKARILAVFIFFFACCALPAQEHTSRKAKVAFKELDERGEVYFYFFVETPLQKNEISRIVSVHTVRADTIFAFANKPGFEKFLTYQLDYQLLDPPSKPKSKKKSGLLGFYPAYFEYVDKMSAFAAGYPNICELHEIGTSVNGRKILFVKISDNVNSDEPEPEFMYSATMHGNELTGYVFMLRLIDSLLVNYKKVEKITNLVNELEIWINPLANPDGAYKLGDSSVYGSTRYNANFVDLNRNFPDPAAGNHPDGQEYQPENLAMMDFMESHHFSLSANLHTGEEVVNYPWDCWSRRHVDNQWFIEISREYADTLHALAGGNYFSGFDNGITNGYDWYRVYGGRQDYVTYFLQGRETTIELSRDFIPDSALLEALWFYNYPSMLNYMDRATMGVSGFVVDEKSNRPMMAKLEVLGFDSLYSCIYSDSVHGFYTRYLPEGVYDFCFSRPGYEQTIIEDVSVPAGDKKNTELVVLNMSLKPIDSIYFFPVPFNDRMILFTNMNKAQQISMKLFDTQGKEVFFKGFGELGPGHLEIPVNTSSLSSGVYVLELQIDGKKQRKKVVKLKN